MILDFSDTILVTKTNCKRNFLFTVISSVISNIKNTEWLILLDGCNGLDIKEKIIINELCKVNNNRIRYYNYYDKSIGYMLGDAIKTYYGNARYFFNIDDDIIPSFEALQNIRYFLDNTDKKLYILTQFDIYNGRKHKDWDNIVRDFSSIDEIDEPFIAHHLWRSNNMIKGFPCYRCISGVYAMKIEWFKKNAIKKMLEWKKGVRGYDTYISLMIDKKDKLFIASSPCYHLGCFDNFYNDTWEKHYDGYTEKWLIGE